MQAHQGRFEPGILLLAGAFAAAYAVLSIARHETFGSAGFDLGLFDQAVWRYANLELPESSLKGVNLLGDHFSPILALLAPLSWVWPDPKVLLLAQAGLVAASAIPVFLFARPRIGTLPAYLLATGYLLFGGVQAAVEFDFHEVAFAPLLIALAVLFADSRRWRAYFLTIALLLLVKEDMAFLVIAFGAYLALLGESWRVLATAAAGLAWFFLTTELLIPHFADGRDYGYWSYSQLGEDLPDAVGNIVASPTLPFEVAVEPARKIRTMLYLFGAFLGLTLLSPLAVLTVPLIAERMLSTNPKFWGLEDHYSLTIAPVLALGAAAGIALLASRVPALRNRAAGFALATTAIIALMALALSVTFPLGDLTAPSTYRTDPPYRDAERVLSMIPAGASVTASNRLVPHLSRRDRVHVLGEGRPSTRYVVANLADAEPEAVFPASSVSELRRLLAGLRRGYVTLYDDERWLVMRRR